MKKFFFITLLVLSQLALAEHPLTDITGKDIALKNFDHAIAGSIKDFVIFGHNDEDKNLSELTIKKHGQIITARLEKSGNTLGGIIGHEIAGIRYETKIAFAGVNANESKIFLQINGEPVEVLIKAEGFENNHFVNPQYIVTFANGETFDYKIMSGHACFKTSIHLAMMIVGAYAHQ